MLMNSINKLDIKKTDFVSNPESNFQTICNFYKSGFEIFDNVDVKITQKDEQTYMLIYLDSDKKMYIKLYYLSSVLSSGDKVCDIYMDVIKDNIIYFSSSSGTSNYYHFAFFISIYGIIFTTPFSDSYTSYTDQYYTTTADITTHPWNRLNCIFVPADVPTLIWNYASDNNNNHTGNKDTYYTFSINHDNVETIEESSTYFASNLGSQKILLIHAFSFDYPINTPHLYRVLGKSADTSYGRILVSGKTLFWLGRFALEFVQ